MPFLQLPLEALQYKRQWVALSPDLTRVVSHGQTPDEALQAAKDAGEENALLLFIPDQWPQTLVV